MKTERLSLSALKAKAEITDKNDAVEMIQGGAIGDCHGITGAHGKVQAGRLKAMYDFADAINRLFGWRVVSTGGPGATDGIASSMVAKRVRITA
ncbi:MAG: hypothetical protein EOP56_10380 [Sphingobacteriales bacterium]|nr:MAG: hypothetical protein EOP56_10380 [Sphingobacteriales bacterium]